MDVIRSDRLDEIDALSWMSRDGELPRRSEWAWQNFKHTVVQLTRLFDHPRVMEIGAGRNPLFSADEVAELNIDYVLNDVSERELSLAKIDAELLCFDFAGDGTVPDVAPFDIVFSRMVLEHVKSGGAYYRNILSVLRSGGVVLTFYPTLYSPPFLINRLTPEWLSAAVLKLFFPVRTDSGIPKFPARYSWCYSTERVRNRIKSFGYSTVAVVPFYGHNYFRSLPLIREIDRAVWRIARQRSYRALSSYAYSFCIK